jgi:hypothetical protein
MVFTKQVLVFARSTDDEVVEVIQLNEIKDIKDNSARDQTGHMNLAQESENPASAHTTKGESANAKKTFLIETSEDGYNAGRMYILQVKTEKDFKAIIEDLTRLCKIAREKAEARSKFKKTQDRVSKIFNSNLVQGFFSLLIVAVRVWCFLTEYSLCLF